MNPEPIWDWPSSVQFLGWYRVEGESSKFRNSVGYITAMNALQCNAMATDAIMAKRILPTVWSEIGCPRLASAPTMRSYPQPEFSRAKRTTSSSTIAEIRGRPGYGRDREPSNLRAISRRYQARIVSGLATQATLSRAFRRSRFPISPSGASLEIRQAQPCWQVG